LLTLLLRTMPFSKSSDCDTAVIDLISSEKSPSCSPKKLSIISMYQLCRKLKHVPPAHNTKPPHILLLQVSSIILRLASIRGFQLAPGNIQSLRTSVREIVPSKQTLAKTTLITHKTKQKTEFINVLPTNSTRLPAPLIHGQNFILDHKRILLPIAFPQTQMHAVVRR
jgi:hypothetical protein